MEREGEERERGGGGGGEEEEEKGQKRGVNEVEGEIMTYSSAVLRGVC